MYSKLKLLFVSPIFLEFILTQEFAGFLKKIKILNLAMLFYYTRRFNII